MLYAQNGATDAKLRCDEHEHLDLGFSGLGENYTSRKVKPGRHPDLDLARFPRLAGVTIAGTVAEDGRGGACR